MRFHVRFPGIYLNCALISVIVVSNFFHWNQFVSWNSICWIAQWELDSRERKGIHTSSHSISRNIFQGSFRRNPFNNTQNEIEQITFSMAHLEEDNIAASVNCSIIELLGDIIIYVKPWVYNSRNSLDFSITAFHILADNDENEAKYNIFAIPCP